MNRSEFIDEVAKRTGLGAESARSAIEAIFGSSHEAGAIADVLRRGERLQLSGFGTFEARHRQERQGRNPKTRQTIVIPATVAPVFRAGSHLKGRLR